ncbi:MAG: hypothetical protein A2173_03770 [Planctomycetes bacterium RBG_13_44_8b]|nr:MAG: hypothetical protein A2173_03770 [Planctomycetes bacterium RBG_13_44_8b]
MPKVIGIISAKLAAEARIPNKVLLPLAGKSMLAHHIERMKAAPVDEISVATSRWPGNDIVEKIAKQEGVKCYAGSENDVISRHIAICEKEKADACIRIPCDSPLFEYDVIAELIRSFRQSSSSWYSYVYVNNVSFEYSTMPELVSLNALKKAHEYYQGPAVTLPIWEHWEDFVCCGVPVHKEYNRPEYRLAVDTPMDYVAMSHIYAALYQGKPISLDDVYRWLDANPHIGKLCCGSEHSAINKRFLEAQKNAQSGINS